jgi:organic hydroperoxide reductase OsmC/OhrA
MSLHRAVIDWTLREPAADFAKGRYSRLHTVGFECGATLPGTPSTSIVPAPWSSTEAVDPEAAFTAALSACHMLTFIDLARRAGFVVAAYRDEAEGTLARVDRGKMAMTRVALRPAITWSGDKRPNADELDQLHHQAHELCFIANSVTTEVVVEPPVG